MARRRLLDTDLDSGFRRSVRGLVIFIVVVTIMQVIVALVLRTPLDRTLLAQAIVVPLTLAFGVLLARRSARRR